MAVADIQGGINFLCQRCQQPLKLSSTLYSLDEHTLAELSLPISPAHNIDIESQVNTLVCLSVWSSVLLMVKLDSFYDLVAITHIILET